VRDQLVGSLPDPGFLLLQDVGHLPNLEEPELFNAALRAFASSAS
jgi:pimeloyl-ACP methyl ester carboxylesterase